MKNYFTLVGKPALVIVCVLLTINLNAQEKVGINTTTPKETVHVMGGLLIQGAILVGESASPASYNIDVASSSTDTSGYLYDSGGPTGDYSNNEIQSCLINPSGATSVRITIDSLDTESPYDYVVVEWPNGSKDTLTGSQTGSFDGAPPVTIQFKSNSANVAAGFKIEWNGIYPAENENFEQEGLGARLHWIPGKSAFRTGYVDGNQWNLDSIGQYSFGSGFNVKATGISSSAIGEATIASGLASIAMGHSNTASGNYSTAMGFSTKASKGASTAMGSNTIASGYNCTAMGSNTIASGYNSTAMGLSTQSNGYSSTVLGMFNDTIAGVQTAVNGTTPLFIIGNGDDANSRSNAMVVQKDASALWLGKYSPSPNEPPVSGAGTRMMWYPEKVAFRAGLTTTNDWDRDSIGNYSMALGYNVRAKGDHSTALGTHTRALEEFSSAFGLFTEAKGLSSTAMGKSTIASGDYSTSMGILTEASGIFSTAMGRSTKANGFASVVIGVFNDPIIEVQTAANDSTPLFIIGNGDNASSRSNAMIVQKDASALWTGSFDDSSPNDPPASGAGTRMMWYPKKAAFRAGHVTGNQWNKDSIGNYSVALGFNSLAKGGYSFATGNNTIASHLFSTAMGQGSIASGYASTAMGYETKAKTDNCIAMGYQTIASGIYSIAMGNSTRASGNNSTATGLNTKATGDISMALGNSTQSNGYASTVIGMYNDTIIGAQTSVNDATPLFIIGNGVASNNRSNAMVVQKDASALWTGAFDDSSPNVPPASGAGTRMMWYPDKAAFRAGYVVGVNWDKDSIGNYSMALGYNVRAKGDHSTALGTHTRALEEFSSAFGLFTEAKGLSSTAMGQSTIASGSNSTSMGIYTVAESLAGVALGQNNVGGGNPTSWVDTDPIFEIGIGAFLGTPANAMTVLKNGNVGIGTTNPEEALHVEGIIEVNNKIQANNSNGLELATDEGTTRLKITDTGNVGIGTSSSSARLHVNGAIKFGNTETIEDGGTNQIKANGSIRPRFNNTYDLGTSTYKWVNVYATNGTIQTSDRRSKTNIQSLQYGLIDVLKLQPVSFEWNNTAHSSSKLGLIAQDVLEVLPEVVKTHDWVLSESSGEEILIEMDRLGIYYSDIIPVLINAIKEQNEIVESQQATINILSAKMDRMEGILKKLTTVED